MRTPLSLSRSAWTVCALGLGFVGLGRAVQLPDLHNGGRGAHARRGSTVAGSLVNGPNRFFHS